jgi:hypothetical protein
MKQSKKDNKEVTKKKNERKKIEKLDQEIKVSR